MTHCLSHLQTLRRPPLLIRAARACARDYARQRHLRQLLGDPLPDSAELVLTRLIPIESRMDSLRRDSRADYSVCRHIEILAAMMAEARRLRTGLSPAEPPQDVMLT